MQKRHSRGVRKRPDKHVTNEDIKASEIRLIGEDGEQLGVISRQDALLKAEEAGVDLVQVASNTDPPVCRLLDYGKLKYREQKKAAEAKKHSATSTIKELRVRYSIDAHDLETKIRSAKKFLTGGDRVKFQMRFRGREREYEHLGVELFNRIAEMLEDWGAIEQRTPVLGRQMSMTIVPKMGLSAAEKGSSK